jgi:hypothetical protein
VQTEKLLATLALLGLLLPGMAGVALAQRIVVIANNGLHLSADELVDVFLGDRHFAGGVKLVPVDNGPLQEAFVTRVLGMNVTKYNGTWAKKSFREGFNPPPVKSGDAEVTEYVRRTPGAIGYVGDPPGDVTVIQRY